MRFSLTKGPASLIAGLCRVACFTAAALFCLGAPAQALLAALGSSPLFSATWDDGSSDFNNSASWTPNNVPNFVATFAGNPNFNVEITAMDTFVQTLNFAATASAYTIETTGGSLTIGAVINASGNTQTFNVINGFSISVGDNALIPSGVTLNVNDGTLNFFDTASAGNAVIAISNTAGVMTRFYDNSSAGNATITNDNTLAFYDNSTAANADITNNRFLQFFNNSSAGNSTIVNWDNTSFFENSTAGTATIVNRGVWGFYNFSTAGSAEITNFATLEFRDNSTAGNATITNNCCLHFYGMSNAGTANITNNSSLSFENDASAASSIITNNAAGTVTFADDSTAANATITTEGAVFFDDNSKAASASITINDNGGVAFNDNASAQNAMIVNNSSLFPGLVFDGFSTAANATITTNDGAVTYFAGNSTGGNARFIVNGTGLLDFSGSLGPAGTGALTAGSFEGDGEISIGGVTLTVGSNNLSTIFSGSITDGCGCGIGNLIKTGTGTLTLDGFNTYSGFTEVQQGELRLTGVIQSFSTVTVFSGATLSGDGSIFGDLIINGGAIFRPDGSFGQMSVFGNVTFENNSRFQVTIDGTGGTTSVGNTGTVQINGGTVEVTALPGTYAAGTQYFIVNSGGGVTGTFSSVQENLAFFDFNVIYDPGAVILELFRNANTFNTFALTRNQRGVAGALDAADPSSALVQALSGLTPEQARAALDLLSGEIYATLAGAFIDESRLFRNAIFSRLRNTAFTGVTGPLGYLSEQDEQALAYTRTNRSNPFNALRRADRGFEYWAQAFGSWAKYDSDSNAASARRNTGGFVFGLDKMLMDGVRAGLSAGYSNTQVRINDRGSKAEGDTLHLAAYLSKLDGRWSYRAGAGLAAHNVDSERNVLGDNLRANYFALTSQFFGEAAYGMTAGQFALEPFVNLALVHHYTGGFTEAGGNTTITTNGFNNTAAFSTLGMRIATRYNLANGQVLIPRATVAWQHAFGDLAPTATLTFQNTGTGMTIAGTPLARDMLLTEVGFDIRLSPFQTLGFFYAATAASDSTEHSLRVKYEWRF